MVASRMEMKSLLAGLPHRGSLELLFDVLGSFQATSNLCVLIWIFPSYVEDCNWKLTVGGKNPQKQN